MSTAEDSPRPSYEELARLHEQLGSAYDELRTAQAELVNSARLASLGMLVAGVAHELNTPLGALRSNSDVLLRGLARLNAVLADDVVEPGEMPELRKIVRAITAVATVDEEAVRRMVDLASSLRTFGRPDASERDFVDLHAGLDSTLALLRHKIPAGVRVQLDYGSLPLVECLPTQIHQLFMNLLLNALHAVAGEGCIRVRTHLAGGDAVVEISDDGHGIPAENLARIFEPGFTTKGSRVGMGLGLLIVRQIVARHHGRIAVESAPGTGACFRVQLPIIMPPDAALDPRGDSSSVGEPT